MKKDPQDLDSPRITTKSLLSWAMYDWANSSFSAIIQTFVFAAYFTKHVAANETLGSAQWGFVNGIAALIVALGGPILGAIADHGKHRKLWIVSFTYLCILATSLLWFVSPNPSSAPLALFLVGLGIIGSELAFVFYNAMLPGLTGPDRIGRWSGFGWSLGYAGGMACLILALFTFINDTPWIQLDHKNAFHVRATFSLVAVWYFLFSLPMFLFTPDTSGKGKNIRKALREGTQELWQTLANIRCYGHIVRFLIAHMFYIDGLTTLFAFGGIYAATKFGMNAQEILLFGISMHVTSGIGAACFAWVDDIIGSKRLIILS
ncbi:MAG: MFS transporter, partial [Waddliaceae bacterium]